MNLSDAASVASVVSSAAIAVSLVYLALQVRQAERNQRGLMQQGRANRVSDFSMRLAENPTLSALLAKGAWTPEQLTVEEFERYLSYCRASFLSGEDTFLQHRAGLLDEASFHGFVAGAQQALVRPGYRAAWRISSRGYGTEYGAFMDGMVNAATTSPTTPTTRTARFEEWRRVVSDIGVSTEA
jgi:hypothetical protein